MKRPRRFRWVPRTTFVAVAVLPVWTLPLATLSCVTAGPCCDGPECPQSDDVPRCSDEGNADGGTDADAVDEGGRE